MKYYIIYTYIYIIILYIYIMKHLCVSPVPNQNNHARHIECIEYVECTFDFMAKPRHTAQDATAGFLVALLLHMFHHVSLNISNDACVLRHPHHQLSFVLNNCIKTIICLLM